MERIEHSSGACQVEIEEPELEQEPIDYPQQRAFRFRIPVRCGASELVETAEAALPVLLRLSLVLIRADQRQPEPPSGLDIIWGCGTLRVQVRLLRLELAELEIGDPEPVLDPAIIGKPGTENIQSFNGGFRVRVPRRQTREPGDCA